MRTMNLTHKGIEYELEIEVEGSGFIINTVTQISGSYIEKDIDPDVFHQDLTNDELLQIDDFLRGD